MARHKEYYSLEKEKMREKEIRDFLEKIIVVHSLRRKTRMQEVLFPRQYFSMFASELGISFSDIARMLDQWTTEGNPSHATVINSIRRCNEMLETKYDKFIGYTRDIRNDLEYCPTPIKQRVGESKNKFLFVVNRMNECVTLDDYIEVKKWVNENIEPREILRYG